MSDPFQPALFGDPPPEPAPAPPAPQAAPRGDSRAAPPAAAAAPDLFAARRALRAPPLLRAFNDAGVLDAADVHVARRLGALAGEEDEAVLLAAALAVRGPRLGHVLADLGSIRATATVDADADVDVGSLDWPGEDWADRVGRSSLVAVGEEGDEARPLRLVGRALYLDRYWREERSVAADLLALAGSPAEGADEARLAAGLRRVFAERPDPRQLLASAAAVLRRLAVVAGGPGTGKTTTVARIAALLLEQAGDERPPLIALAAPTGKAAARLEEAVHGEAATLAIDERVRGQLLDLQASTLHRLLGWRPDSQSRFRHHRGNRLPHDVVIVDETSMVSLSLMARLVEAIRRDARLVLVGDPGQLTSIEAGAVLGDITGPAAGGLRMRPAAREQLARVTGAPVAAADPPSDTPVGDGIVVLERVHRFGAGIADVADAIRRGAADDLLAVLSAQPEGVTWLPGDPAETPLDLVRDDAVGAGRALVEAAARGDARAALDRLGAFRVLCAHRRGPYGVDTWSERIEAWLGEALPGFGAAGRWYAGRPLLVTENDYALRLYNGDTGVVVAAPGGPPTAAFERRAEIATFAPSRLGAVETVHAMTIHKAQGSQFATAVVVLPGAGSQLLSRELLYTAVTRAKERLVVAGTEEALRAAVERPVARASGLGWRLWG